MTIISVNTATTYTALPVTDGYVSGDHTVAWAFDDATSATGLTTSKSWASVGTHLATATATNTVTKGTGVAEKSVIVVGKTAAKTMITARYAHKMVKLDSGKVLIIGGCNQSGGVASCEIYDPTLGTFSSTGSLNFGRCAFSATKLANGDVLVCGGTTGFDSVYPNGTITAPVATCEVYSIVNGTWAYTTGGLATARCFNRSEILPSGKVIVTGGLAYSGTDGMIATTEVYDPGTGTFSAGPTMPSAKAWHGSVRTPSGSVLVWGGGVDVKTYEYTEGGSWVTKADCITASGNSVWAFAYSSYGDSVYQFSGAAGTPQFISSTTAYAKYSIAADTWTNMGTIALFNGWGGASVGSSNGHCVSGISPAGNVCKLVSSSVLGLDNRSDGGWWIDAITLDSGYAMFTGGFKNPGVSNACDLYYIGT
jgi:hypothetical protein